MDINKNGINKIEIINGINKIEIMYIKAVSITALVH